MTDTQRNLIVISDLDGTLLDHYTYQFTAAKPSLDLLSRHNIPLILNSSKTAAEILVIRTALGNREPFITENGGGIYLPDGDELRIVAMGTPRNNFLEIIKRVQNEMNLSFRGFHDMTEQELMECTGLSLDECIRAKQREFTEPLLWNEDNTVLQKFSDELKRFKLQVTRGGRFVHVSGATDKGKSIQWLRNYYTEKFNSSVFVIALGDSLNDTQMLECADYALVVRSPVHKPPDIHADRLLISQQEGPQGWNECIHQCLVELEIITE